MARRYFSSVARRWATPKKSAPISAAQGGSRVRGDEGVAGLPAGSESGSLEASAGWVMRSSLCRLLEPGLEGSEIEARGDDPPFLVWLPLSA